MLNGYFIASVLIAVAFILTGIITMARNPKSKLNKLFMLFSITLAIWLVSNYLASNNTTQQHIALIANRFTFAFAAGGTLTFFLFMKNLTTSKVRFENFILILNLVTISASFTPLVVNNIHPQGNSYAIDFGVLSGLYFLTIGINMAILIHKLFYTRKKSTGVYKAQLYVIQVSFTTGLFAIIIANAFLPIVFGYYGLTNFGALFSAFFIVGIAYAIIKHRLFDLRSIVARSIAYLLSLISLLGIYGGIIFVASTIFFTGDSVGFSQQAFYAFAAIVAALSLQPLKKFFDKITNQLFYRDAYDTQVFLDELNNVLVANIDLQRLLTDIIKIIEDNLKATYTVFSIRETAYFSRRTMGDLNKKFDEDEVMEINKLASHIPEKVIVTDYLEDNDQDLRRVLEKNEVSILIRLVATLDYDIEGIGYILFGPKKSGNPYNKQDIQTLEIIANELIIAIQNSLRFEEIEKFNVTLQDKVEDATRRLQKSNEKLKTMDETKDEFISMASHQLRTPLTSVKGYLSMVLEGDAGDVSPMQHKLLDQAFTSSQRMVYLIADLLNVSRLRTGKFVIEPIATDLSEVVDSEAHQLQGTAKGRGLTLDYQKPASFCRVMLDETKIRQVIMNFMDNAIYYTPTGGHIVVALQETDKTIEYTVTDNGLGVPKSEQHHLFTKFYRAVNAKKARPDGTGLGLFMAKKVIIAQGGSLIFKSQEGKGSTFGFVFDKAKIQIPDSKDK